MLVGQLLATSKAASEGIKSLADEQKTHSEAIVSVTKTLEIFERAFSNLSKIVKDGDGGDSLMTSVSLLRRDTAEMLLDIQNLDKDLTTLASRITAIENSRLRAEGSGWLAMRIATIASWMITAGLALYGALGRWRNG